MLENYKAKYFTGKDVDKNNWVSRNEFYGYNTAAHDELWSSDVLGEGGWGDPPYYVT